MGWEDNSKDQDSSWIAMSKEEDIFDSNQEDRENSDPLIIQSLGGEWSLDKEVQMDLESRRMSPIIRKALADFFEKCEYTCGRCEEKLPTYSQLCTHVRATHKNIAPKEYWAKYGHCRSKTVRHCCKICKKEVIHTKGEITRHLNKSHSMTLIDYKDRYLTESDGSGKGLEGDV